MGGHAGRRAKITSSGETESFMSAVWQNKDADASTSGKGQDVELGSLKTSTGGYVCDAQASVRLGFIRKVYGILSIQMVLSVGMAVLFMFEPSTHSFVLSSPGLYQLAIFAPLGFLVALICNKNNYPLNIGLLSAFTLCEAYGVGVICAVYQEQGQGAIVLQAFILTAAIFCSLTAYTMISKKDFSFMGASLGTALWVLIFWSLLNLIFPSVFGGFGRQVFSLLGALLFSLYILYDTSMIMRRLGPDDYIMAAVDLYLDILNLFLFILEILSKSDS